MNAALEFHSPHLGRERLEPRLSIPRHRHQHGYIAVVLSGGYQEAGLAGRFDLTAGDVVVHRAFDAHLDHVSQGGAEVLNLPLPRGACLPAVFRIDDVDAIARAAERDAHHAAVALMPSGDVSPADDWPDHLASAVTNFEEQTLGSWADAKGLAAETLSRGFRKAYGVTPARFRAETRAYQALHLITESDAPLAAIAAECGFADQPHLTRAIVQLTGHPPGSWRRGSILFKTARSRAR
jgi:AraC-like DNA-binding protein